MQCIACLEREHWVRPTEHARNFMLLGPLTDPLTDEEDTVVEMGSGLPRVAQFIQPKPIPFILRKANA